MNRKQRNEKKMHQRKDEKRFKEFLERCRDIKWPIIKFYTKTLIADEIYDDVKLIKMWSAPAGFDRGIIDEPGILKGDI